MDDLPMHVSDVTKALSSGTSGAMMDERSQGNRCFEGARNKDDDDIQWFLNSRTSAENEKYSVANEEITDKCNVKAEPADFDFSCSKLSYEVEKESEKCFLRVKDEDTDVSSSDARIIPERGEVTYVLMDIKREDKGVAQSSGLNQHFGTDSLPVAGFDKGLECHSVITEIGTCDRRFACSVCGKAFSRLRYLNIHVMRHSAERLFPCTFCSKSFKSSGPRWRHEKIHIKDKRFLCEICGMRFKGSSELYSHMTTHSDERPFQCELCGTGFKRRTSKYRHLRRTHGFEEGYSVYEKPVIEEHYSHPFSRKKCVKTLNSSKLQNANSKTHTSGRPFSCSLCPKSFKYQKQLKVHVRFHKGNLPHACGVCEKYFRQKKALNAHRKIHDRKGNVEKSFSDNHHNRVSNSPVHEEFQMIIPNSELPFKCDACEESFKTNGSLYAHMTVHGGRVLRCNFCNQSFLKKYHLNVHLKSHDIKQKPDVVKRSFIVL